MSAADVVETGTLKDYSTVTAESVQKCNSFTMCKPLSCETDRCQREREREREIDNEDGEVRGRSFIFPWYVGGAKLLTG